MLKFSTCFFELDESHFEIYWFSSSEIIDKDSFQNNAGFEVCSWYLFDYLLSSLHYNCSCFGYQWWLLFYRYEVCLKKLRFVLFGFFFFRNLIVFFSFLFFFHSITSSIWYANNCWTWTSIICFSVLIFLLSFHLFCIAAFTSLHNLGLATYLAVLGFSVINIFRVILIEISFENHNLVFQF